MRKTEKDREKQKHDPSKHCALWSFSSGPNTLTSSTEPGIRESLHNKRHSYSHHWLPAQALKSSRALCPGSDKYHLCALERWARIL